MRNGPLREKTASPNLPRNRGAPRLQNAPGSVLSLSRILFYGSSFVVFGSNREAVACRSPRRKPGVGCSCGLAPRGATLQRAQWRNVAPFGAGNSRHFSPGLRQGLRHATASRLKRENKVKYSLPLNPALCEEDWDEGQVTLSPSEEGKRCSRNACALQHETRGSPAAITGKSPAPAPPSRDGDHSAQGSCASGTADWRCRESWPRSRCRRRWPSWRRGGARIR